MSTPSHPDAADRVAGETPKKRSIGRRLLRWTLRGATAVMILVVVLLTAGFAWDQVASRRYPSDFPPPGRQVPLPDGRNLHFVVKGEGEPTLVLESGAGGPHSDWAPVIDKLAESTRVIVYDRAGYGWSDPSSEFGVASITADLHDGLNALDVEGPIVLVGHSIGGPYIRHYASTHPDDVAGMVFVDSSHEDQQNRMPQPMVEMMDQMTKMVGAAALASRFGVLRALDSFGASPFTSKSMSDQRRAMALRSSTSRAYARELAGIEEVLRQAREAAVPFGELPILVLSATAQDPSVAPPDMREHFDDFQAAWREMQADLAQLSSNSRHVPVPEAGHYIQFDRPDIVVDEIRAMIEAIRAGEPLSVIASASGGEAEPE